MSAELAAVFVFLLQLFVANDALLIDLKEPLVRSLQREDWIIDLKAHLLPTTNVDLVGVAH